MSPPASSAPRRKATPAELAAAIFLFLAALVLAGTLVRERLARRPARVDADPLAGSMIVPSAAQEGVVVTPGPGRLLFVDTTPDSAELWLDGARRGETPFSSDFSCDDEQKTMLELRKPGYQVARFELDCVRGSTRVSATLKRAR